MSKRLNRSFSTFFKTFVFSILIISAFFTTPDKAHAVVSDEEFARLYADLSVMSAEVGRNQLGWLDGQETSIGYDAGRGVSNWHAHFAYAMNNNRRQTVPQLIQTRLQTILNYVSFDVMAKLYGNMSVTIASLGRQKLNWIDGPDQVLDSGRGISSYSTHYNYVMIDGGGVNTPWLISERLTTILGNVAD